VTDRQKFAFGTVQHKLAGGHAMFLSPLSITTINEHSYSISRHQ